MEVAVFYKDQKHKRVRMGTRNREPQEYSRNIIEYSDPGRYMYSLNIPTAVYSWGSLFGVPSKVHLTHSGTIDRF